MCAWGRNISVQRNPAATLKHNGGKEGANTEKQYNFAFAFAFAFVFVSAFACAW